MPVLLALSLALHAAAASGAEETSLRPLPQPAAGTRLPAAAVEAAPVRLIDFGALAREDALRPKAAGPPVGIEMPEGEGYVEPDAAAPPSSLRVSTLQSTQAVSPAALLSFAGLDDIARIGTTTIVIPPDTDGAVGLTKIMEGLNNNYRILDKSSGNVSSTVSITTFWSATGRSGFFDPKMLYDPYHDRWIVCALSDAQTANSSILVGISTSGDPSGSWFLTSFDVDATNTNWADFPTIGFDQSWVAINVNLYPNAGGGPVGSECLVLDHPSMLSGVFHGTMITGTGFCSSPCATYSASETTLYVPTHLSSSSGTYRVDLVTGTPPAAPVYTVGATHSRGLTWSIPGGNQLPQPAPVSGASACSPPCKIEAQDPQIRSTPVFRNGSIWYTQTVIPTGASQHTAVQWTKLDAGTAMVQDGGRIEDPSATATNGGKWYAYPHVAVNSCGDAIVGFSQFSSAQFASAGHAFRYAADPAGTMRDPVIDKPGEDYYHKDFGSGRNRWGDYSKAQVDPADDVGLWVLDEYAKLRQGTDDGTTGSNASRWGTWWAKVGPGISIAAGPELPEGNSGTKDFNFSVILSPPACVPVTVNYRVDDGTATLADNDYQVLGSSIVIPAGAAGGTITVRVVGDTKREANETFHVALTSASAGDIGPANSATGTIDNDDPVPSISIADMSANEGDSGTTPFHVGATLGNPTDQTVTVSWATQDGTATVADGDYVAGSGTLTFPPGTTGPQDAVFNVNGDTKTESDETVLVNLSSPSAATIARAGATATIRNDDPLPAVSIDDVSVPEGNSGTTNANFTVSLSHLSDQPVSVSYQTADGSATVADADYVAASGTVNIAANATSAPLAIAVNGDTRCEPNETFQVTLSAPAGATIGKGSGQGTIVNDDPCLTPAVAVVAPNGGEWHYLGEAVDFTWSATDSVGVTTVDLRLSRDGGATFEDIALGGANDGLYTWTAVGPPTDQALLQVVAHDAAGNTGSDVSDATWHLADAVAVPSLQVTAFALGPVRPNPSRGDVSIGYDLPREGDAAIEVLDVQGRVVATLVQGFCPAGRHAVRWSPPHAAPSGLFFARARLGGKVFRRRFVVTR